IIRVGQFFNRLSYANSTLAITADRLYALPCSITRPMTLDRLAFEVTGAGAGGTAARLGIYDDDGAGYPGALVVDAGTVLVDGVGVKAITINQAIEPGLYWLGLVSDGTPTIRAHQLTTWSQWIGVNVGNLSTTNWGWFVAHVFAALPDPYTGGGTLGAGGNIPSLFTRASSLD
ncbi:hypothetical protein LCGC14_2983100, partial [marine sediment metagenome]